MRINSDSAEKVREAVKKGGVKIKLDPKWMSETIVETDALDTLNPSTARGQHGTQGFTKPDVAASGTSIKSAAVAGGNAPATMTGTSMAAPHVAGVAALVAQAHPEYSLAELKAAIMNTANNDLKDAEGDVFSVERVGSGRIDAKAAVDTNVLLYNADRPEQVSTSFGVVEIAPDKTGTFTRNFTVENKGDSARTFKIDFATSSELQGVTISAPESVTVGAHGKATIPVTATVDGSQLAKQLDPATEEIQFDIARQYISTLSSRMILTDGAQQLRVPVQIAPKPVADMHVDGEISFQGSQKTAQVSLAGTALNQNGYVSAFGAFQLGAESPRIPTGKLGIPSAQAADLQYVGANSTVPAQLATNDLKSTPFINFGISSWGNWETINPAFTYEIDIDVNKDNAPEFFVLTSRIKGLDYPIAQLYKKQADNTYKSIDAQPINGVTGETDTNIMDSNTMVLPVNLSALNLTPQQMADFRYVVYSVASGHDNYVDQTDWISYNPAQPHVAFGSDQKIGTSLFADNSDTGLTAYSPTGKAARALFLHLHNGTGDLSGIQKGEDGAKAEVVETQKEVDILDPRFVDVQPDNMFYKEINWLATRGITNGWSDSTFRPADSVERGAMAAFFYRMAGSPQYTAPSTSRFSDVATDHPFYKEISWLAEQNITTGWDNGTFRPSNPIARDAMAAFLYRYDKNVLNKK